MVHTWLKTAKANSLTVDELYWQWRVPESTGALLQFQQYLNILFFFLKLNTTKFLKIKFINLLTILSNFWFDYKYLKIKSNGGDEFEKELPILLH